MKTRGDFCAGLKKSGEREGCSRWFFVSRCERIVAQMYFVASANTRPPEVNRMEGFDVIPSTLKAKSFSAGWIQVDSPFRLIYLSFYSIPLIIV